MNVLLYISDFKIINKKIGDFYEKERKSKTPKAESRVKYKGKNI